MKSRFTSTYFVFYCPVLLLAACTYTPPSVDSNVEVGGFGGAGSASVSSSSNGNGGFGGATSSSSSSSSSSISSSATSSSSSSGSSMTDCGDNKLDTNEECDDGNTRPGDGCDGTCHKENHDSCGAPLLKLGIETVTIKGTTDGAMDDIKATPTVEYCTTGIYPGPDLIYAVRPTANGTLTATLVAEYPNHLLRIRNTCPGFPTDEIGCDMGSTIGETDTSIVQATSGKNIYVIVDGYMDNAGSFLLELTLQ